MIPTPDRVTRGQRHWWLWFYDTKPKPGVTRHATLITIRIEGIHA